MRVASSLFLVLVLVACGGPQQSRAPIMRAEAAFAGPDRLAIQVQLIDVPPGTLVEEIALLGPAGPVRVAGEMIRSSHETGSGTLVRPTFGLAVTGGSKSGINPSLSIGGQVTGDGPGRRQRRIKATIPIDDLPDYGDPPGAWRLEIRYLDSSATTRTLTLAAPRRR